MVFLKVVSVGLASPRGLTVQCFPQEYFSPTPPFHFRCVGPYKLNVRVGGKMTFLGCFATAEEAALSYARREAGRDMVAL